MQIVNNLISNNQSELIIYTVTNIFMFQWILAVFSNLGELFLI